MTSNFDSVRAVGRALDILLAFTPQDGTAQQAELTAAELLTRVTLSRPTLYRLLYTLEAHRFLVSEGEPQRFRLGPAVAQLAHTWSASLDVGSLAQPMMRQLWRESGETVALFVPQGVMRVCVAELPSAQALSFKRGTGYQERIAIGASGRVMLAHLAADTELTNWTQGTQVDPKKLARELATIRSKGFATSKNELIQGAVAVAAPFFNGAGKVAGALAVFGPAVRINTKQAAAFGELVKAQAQTLSRSLGYARGPGG
jgi:DNA-binding IclR family transcriptional regulator